MKHKNIEAAFAQYVTGNGSLRQVAANNGLSDSTVLKRSKNEGWKDLRDNINVLIQSEIPQQLKERLLDGIEDSLETTLIESATDHLNRVISVASRKLSKADFSYFADNLANLLVTVILTNQLGVAK